jgi:hypothetical protein
LESHLSTCPLRRRTFSRRHTHLLARRLVCSDSPTVGSSPLRVISACTLCFSARPSILGPTPLLRLRLACATIASASLPLILPPPPPPPPPPRNGWGEVESMGRVGAGRRGKNGQCGTRRIPCPSLSRLAAPTGALSARRLTSPSLLPSGRPAERGASPSRLLARIPSDRVPALSRRSVAFTGHLGK